MKGYQIAFFTSCNRRHRGRPVYEWLIESAQALGIFDSTIVMAAEGSDQSGRRHSVRFVELADQTLGIKITTGMAESTRLFELLKEENVNLFYVQTEVEFGTVGVAQAGALPRLRDGPAVEPSHHH